MNRTPTNLVALFTALLTLAGCGVAGTEEATDELKAAAKPTTQTYALRTTDAKAASPTWKTSFNIANTYDVYLASDVGTATGHHRDTVIVKMPGGSDYQRFDITYAAGVSATAGEQIAEKTSTGAYRVWVKLPIAGTMIEQYGLSGPWAAETYVDGAAVANARADFTLQ